MNRMRRRWCLVASLAIVMLVAGCAVTVGGTAQPASPSAPRSLTGRSIKHVLLGHGALSRILKEPLNIDPRFAPRFGGPESLLNDELTSPMVACLGVAAMLQQSVYQSGNIKGVAAETWRHAARSAEVTSVKEAVVSLPTAADADALFARFSHQWQKCNGATQPLPGRVFRLKALVTNVQVDTSVLAATVSTGWATPRSGSASIPAGRAIGVKDNCLIEVEVDFFNVSSASKASLQGPGDINNSALDIAQIMIDKVGALR
jgi:PknH-like extracellular domain